MTRTKKLVIVSDTTPEDQYIGYVTISTIPDAPVPASKLARLWKDADLDPEGLPAVRTSVDVFRSACGSVRTKRGHDHHDGRVEIRSDEILNGESVCAYQITRAVWDLDKQVIEHEMAMRVRYAKSGGVIEWDQLNNGGQDPALDAIGEQIVEHCDAHATTVNGAAVRRAVRELLDRFDGTEIKGGVTFVPKGANGEGRAMLDAVKSVLRELYAEKAHFHRLPCADNASERQMVATHFSLNAGKSIEKELATTVARIREMEAGTANYVRADFIGNRVAERRAIAGAIDRFDQLVGIERTDLEAKLLDLDQSIDRLQALADAPAPA